MSGWSRETEASERFLFGRNWSQFLASVDEDRVRQSEHALAGSLRVDSLEGKRFLDVGGGSGLHSLAALRLGAIVRTFDYDPDSVECARRLKAKFAPDDPGWTIESGSALDPEYLGGLGTFDVVYSWGVLHHTGEMWRALDLVEGRVAPGGMLFLALYNDQGGKSQMWRAVKRAYVRAPAPGKLALVVAAGSVLQGRPAVARLLHGQNPLPFALWKAKREDRGMSVWTDLVDWVGGYPFEVARPEEVFEFYRGRGYRLEHLKTCGGGHGCNEFVFIKTTE